MKGLPRRQRYPAGEIEARKRAQLRSSAPGLLTIRSVSTQIRSTPQALIRCRHCPVPPLCTLLRPYPLLTHSSSHLQVLPDLLLQSSDGHIRSWLGRYLFRLLLDHCIHWCKMRNHGLCPNPTGQVVWHIQEKDPDPFRRAKLDHTLLYPLLGHRHVHHVQIRLLAQPPSTVERLAD